MSVTRVLHVSAASQAHHCDGSRSAPFRSIGQAAACALPGDTVLVHEGVYRESVDPPVGGLGDLARITYAVAEGEHAVITGAEEVTGWCRVEGCPSVWHIEVPNELFGDFNPFARPLAGDWLERPDDWTMSLGQVYLDGVSMFEAPSLDAVTAAEPRTWGWGPGWANEREPIDDPAATVWQWHAAVDDARGITDVWANFHDLDPNDHLTEINVRETCFRPSRAGVNYLTVKGFEMRQAACGWAPPTGDQRGLLDTHWSKGWIIEGNDIHDARCSAISLGKDASTGDNESSRFHRKPGYQTQLEVVFRALHQGWSKETVGGHVVRGNHLHDCGQNGIVGHLGCAFSLIEGNHIHAIGTKREFFGHEIAGIKLHAAIDATIRGNHIHDCTLGTWLDWQAQGTRVSENVYHGNTRDFMIEVTSGPCLLDNNVFGSDYNLDNVAQGTAFVHNLFCGVSQPRPVLNRVTPYHLPHSTVPAGYACVYGGDDRFLNNVFVGGPVPGKALRRGTAYADGAPHDESEYIARVRARGIGDLELFEQVPQPMRIDGNAYLRGGDGTVAPSFAEERTAFIACEDTGESVAQAMVREEPDGSVWLDVDVPQALLELPTELVDTARLGVVRIVGQPYENPDGTPLRVDHDLIGVARGPRPVPGPVEGLRPGFNRIRLI